MATRLERALRQGGAAGADEGVRLREHAAGAAPRQDRHQHGRRRGACRTRRRSTRPPRTSTAITGQKAGDHQARKKSIATFKLRENMPIGCKVTLRARAHVRVPRPAGEHRAAARARFPRRVAARASTGAAITRSASRSSSCSRRSITTRSMRCAAWTSSSARRRRPTRRRRPCSRGFDMPFVN